MRDNFLPHFSKECSRGGDGQCDGIDNDMDYADCDCPCHSLWEPYPRVEDYRQWHIKYWRA